MEPELIYNEAIKYIDQGDLTEALRLLENAEKQSENGVFPRATYRKGIVLKKLGKTQDAIKAFTQAENNGQQGRFPKASYNKGNIFLDLKNYQKALTSFNKAHDDDHEKEIYPHSIIGVAIVLNILNEGEEALLIYDSIETKGNSDLLDSIYQNKAAALINLGRLEEAVKLFSLAEKTQNNHNPRASFSKGRVLMDLELYNEALKSFKKSIRDGYKDSSIAWNMIGCAWARLDNHEKSVNAFENAENLSKSNEYPSASLNKGFALEELGRYSEALESYMKAEFDSIDKCMPRATLNKAKLLAHFGEHKQAIKAYTKAENDFADGVFPEATLNKGISLYHNEFFDEAILSFEKIKDNWIEAKIANYFKGIIYQSYYKRYLEAIEFFTIAESLGLQSEKEKLYYNKGVCYEKLNNYDKALKCQLKALETSLEGKYPLASCALGTCYLRLGDLDKAIIALTQAEKDSINCKFPDASFKKGFCYEKKGLYKLAIQSYSKAKNDSVGKKYPEANYQKGLCYTKLNDFKKGLKYFLRSIHESNDNKYPEAFFEIGNLFYKARKYSKSLEAYSKAEENSPDCKYPAASNNKGELLLSLGRLDEALVSLTKSEKDAVNGHPSASFNKGALFSRINSYELALESYGKAEDDSPHGQYPVASYLKGKIYFILSDYDSAILSLNKSIEDSEKHFYPEAHLALAKCYFLKKDYKESRIAAFKAVKQSNINFDVIEFINSHFSNELTSKFYSNRLIYIDELLFENEIISHYNRKLFRKYFNKIAYSFSTLDLFIDLLKFDRIGFSVDISTNERLKLCYLIYFKNKEYGRVYYTINGRLGIGNELDDMDLYFQLLTSILIGSSTEELKNAAMQKPNGGEGYTSSFMNLSKSVLTAIENNYYHDEYLLNCTYSEDFNLGLTIREKYHPWIQEVINSFENDDNEYKIPIGNNELKGMLVQTWFAFNKNPVNKISDNSYYNNFKNSLRLIESGSNDYRTLLDNIRHAMINKIGVEHLFHDLGESYFKEGNSTKKKNLSIMQAALLYSYYYDQLQREMLFENHLEVPLTVFAEFVLEGFVESSSGLPESILYSYGFALAFSYAVDLTLSSIEKKASHKKEELFDKIYQDLN